MNKVNSAAKSKSYARFFKGIVVLYFLLLFFVLHKPYLNDFPSFIHAWSQSDMYALAKGFVDNKLDFFHPQTFVFNKQFPDNWTTPRQSRVVAVDFPLHQYVPAVFMRITGSEQPWIYRFYVFLYGLVGLFFLFQMTWYLTRSRFVAFLILLLVSTTPVFVYYHSGFLPSIPSLANAILGTFFYLRFLREKKSRHLWLSMIFFTLAALSRTTFVIPLVALFFTEIIRVFWFQHRVRYWIVPFLISAVTLTGYKVYNAYLFREHGSIFLNHLIPPASFQEAFQVIAKILKNWAFHYFSEKQYILILSLVVLGVIRGVVNQNRRDLNRLIPWLFVITWFFGEMLFFVVMMPQYQAHDYYFLDTFLLPIIAMLILSFRDMGWPNTMHWKISGVVLLLVVGFLFVKDAEEMQQKRRKTGNWDRVNETIRNFEGSAAFLDSLQIPEDAKMLVIDAYAPNIPFLKMNRTGYALMATAKKYTEPALKWDYDYIVFQNEYFVSDIYQPFPDIIQHLKRIDTNGDITICTYFNRQDSISLPRFLQLNKKPPIIKAHWDFEKIPGIEWSHTERSLISSKSGRFSGIVDSLSTYGLTYKKWLSPNSYNKTRTLLFSGWFYALSKSDLQIAVSVASKDSLHYFITDELQNKIRQKNSWTKIETLFQIPPLEVDSAEFGLFIYNPSKHAMLYDDIRFSMH